MSGEPLKVTPVTFSAAFNVASNAGSVDAGRNKMKSYLTVVSLNYCLYSSFIVKSFPIGGISALPTVEFMDPKSKTALRAAQKM